MNSQQKIELLLATASLKKLGNIWVLVGLQEEAHDEKKKFQSLVGCVDWLLHGQVSALSTKNHLQEKRFLLVPGSQQKQQPNYLFYQFENSLKLSEIIDTVKSLRVKEIFYLSETFPPDFSEKLSQNKAKGEIKFHPLELLRNEKR
ncbi:MAG: hypothetical protein M9962_03445 [Oligoflexia bacterium]|nr:hypothetical protein [Oligoflexia bacterium]